MNVSLTVEHPFKMKSGKILKNDMSPRERETFPVVLNFKQYKLAEITWVSHYMPILQAMLMILIDRENQTLQ